LIFSALFSALIILAATRFGLLTLTAALFFNSLFGNYPTTTDFSIWYAPSTFFAFIIAGALVAFAFYTSLGGQKVFQGQRSAQL